MVWKEMRTESYVLSYKMSWNLEGRELEKRGGDGVVGVQGKHAT